MQYFSMHSCARQAKEMLNLFDADKAYMQIYNRSLYSDQQIQHFYGMPSAGVHGNILHANKLLNLNLHARTIRLCHSD